MQETYHSRHGAIQESQYVFIETGFQTALKRFPEEIRVLEVGFGTGLNAWLTLQCAREKQVQRVHYTSLETTPLDMQIIQQLNYGQGQTNADFLSLHEAPWNETATFGDFKLLKSHVSIQSFQSDSRYHVIYYDAFGPPSQPDMWTVAIFQKLFECTEPGGLLVTYCAKGQVRRDLITAGYRVERLPGPPGKREMLRATRDF